MILSSQSGRSISRPDVRPSDRKSVLTGTPWFSMIALRLDHIPHSNDQRTLTDSSGIGTDMAGEQRSHEVEVVSESQRLHLVIVRTASDAAIAIGGQH